MIQKILIGVISGTALGMFMTSMFLPDVHLFALFWTKITSTAMIVGFLCGIYGHFSKSKIQTFMISIFIGIITYYVKYWITGHHFDPGIMGAFTGAIIGAILAIVRKLTQSFKLYKKLEALRNKGFNNYG